MEDLDVAVAVIVGVGVDVVVDAGVVDVVRRKRRNGYP